MNDILKKRAERLFKKGGGTVTDHDLVKVFTVREVKALAKAGLIATNIGYPAWHWKAKESQGR